MQQTRVIQTQGDVGQIRVDLEVADLGLKAREVPSNIAWQLARIDGENGVVTAYSSGKLVVQSSDENWLAKVIDLVDTGVSVNGSDEFVAHIGVDETGKGDYFGPLVVAAAFVGTVEVEKQLRKLGVRDSKQISDDEAVKIADEVQQLVPHTVIVISPEEYNERYSKLRNVNKLLAEGHAYVIEKLLEGCGTEGCENVVVDQFSKDESRVLDALLENGRKLKVEQMHGGESDVAVAAASIIARARFLGELDGLSDKYGEKFPKGASEVVEFGKKFMADHGYEELKKVAKISFKTTLKISSTFDI